MISAWKKFLNKASHEDELTRGNGQCPMPPGVQKLDRELQRKFAKGVNYNMKVVIKGDNRVGKTSLLLRLKGYGFEDNYNPTDSLNVTSIDWSYKATDDIVKIDLWEAVDSASKKNVNFVDLKVENDDESHPKSDQLDQSNGGSHLEESRNSEVIISSTQLVPNGKNNHVSPIPESAKQCLNELIRNFDVYQGADAVLLMMDVTKSWTFKYVQNELPKIPRHIPVLVIANHRDKGHHRTISAVQVKLFIEGLSRELDEGTIMYAETSMKNGFGMKLIEKFFNIPFLKLQEASLRKQLELNEQECRMTLEELKILLESNDREYELYMELETIRRRQQADAMSPVNSGLRQLNETTREQIRSSNLSSDIIDKMSTNTTSIESQDNKSEPKVPVNFVNDRLPSIVIGAKCPLHEIRQTLHVDTKQTDAVENNASDESSEDEEEPRANPLVATYQSDLDSDDQTK